MYYPIYYAHDENGNEVELAIGYNNLIKIFVDEAKSGKVIISCKDRGGYVVADVISAISLVMFISYFVYLEKKKNNEA